MVADWLIQMICKIVTDIFAVFMQQAHTNKCYIDNSLWRKESSYAFDLEAYSRMHWNQDFWALGWLHPCTHLVPCFATSNTVYHFICIEFIDCLGYLTKVRYSERRTKKWLWKVPKNYIHVTCFPSKSTHSTTFGVYKKVFFQLSKRPVVLFHNLDCKLLDNAKINGEGPVELGREGIEWMRYIPLGLGVLFCSRESKAQRSIMET